MKRSPSNRYFINCKTVWELPDRSVRISGDRITTQFYSEATTLSALYDDYEEYVLSNRSEYEKYSQPGFAITQFYAEPEELED